MARQGNILRAAILLLTVASAAIAQGVPDSDGFISLFNGRDLGAWTGNEQQWTVRDGLLRGVSDGKAESALILTGREPRDFQLRFDLRVLKGAAIVQMHGRGRGPVGVQLKIDVSHDPGLVQWTVNGGPAQAVAYVHSGDWNSYRIICNKNSFEAFQNQTQSPLRLIVGDMNATGKLSVVMPEGAASEIEFRNIRLKD